MPTAPPSRERRDCRCPRAQHQHGTKAAYQYDACRCTDCTAANTATARAYRRKVAQYQWNGGTDWTASIGTRRRLQALAAVGWSLTALAAQLDVSPSGVGWLRQIDGPCLRSTAQRVTALYDRLWDEQPTGRAVVRTRAWALRRGWLPPLAWDDDTIDDPSAVPAVTAEPDGTLDDVLVRRLMDGTAGVPRWQRCPERVEAIRRLWNAGVSYDRIGERVGVSRETVDQTLCRHRLRSAA